MLIVQRANSSAVRLTTSLAGKTGVFAQVDFPFPAIFANAARAMKPGDTHSRPGSEALRVTGNVFDDSHCLVTRNDVRSSRWQFVFYNVQICAANAAGADSHQNVITLRLWLGRIYKIKWICVNRRG